MTKNPKDLRGQTLRAARNEIDQLKAELAQLRADAQTLRVENQAMDDSLRAITESYEQVQRLNVQLRADAERFQGLFLWAVELLRHAQSGHPHDKVKREKWLRDLKQLTELADALREGSDDAG